MFYFLSNIADGRPSREVIKSLLLTEEKRKTEFKYLHQTSEKFEIRGDVPKKRNLNLKIQCRLGTKDL